MSGIERIAKERRRQIDAEGWMPEHDDHYTCGELAAAAACYALFADSFPNAGEPPPHWPWDDVWWKPRDCMRDMEKAGALIAAEIDRLERERARDT